MGIKVLNQIVTEFLTKGQAAYRANVKKTAMSMKNYMVQSSQMANLSRHGIRTQEAALVLNRNMDKAKAKETKQRLLARKTQIQEQLESHEASKNMSVWWKRLAFGGMDLNKKTGKLTFGFKKFRMESLSVMFGMQSLSKGIWGLMQPTLEAVGIFKILRVGLLAFFIPVIAPLIKWVVKFINWINKLPPSLKKTIGAFLLAVGIIVSLAAAFSSFLLLLPGLIMVVGLIAGVLSGILGISVTSGTVVAAIGAIIAALSALILAASNWDSFMVELTNMWDKLGEAWAAADITGLLYEALRGTFFALGELLMFDLMEGMGSIIGAKTFGDAVIESTEVTGKWWAGE